MYTSSGGAHISVCAKTLVPANRTTLPVTLDYLRTCSLLTVTLTERRLIAETDRRINI